MLGSTDSVFSPNSQYGYNKECIGYDVFGAIEILRISKIQKWSFS